MGLFSKKEQDAERNEINNEELKEVLVDTALQILAEGEGYHQTADIEYEFGYLFDIDGHGLESLFKIMTDKGTFYFAAQKESLIRLDLSEQRFQSTIDAFLSLHQ